MGAFVDDEMAAHATTKALLELQEQRLAHARREIDRGVIERARLRALLKERDEECEARRTQVAMLARAAGGGAVL
jgi:hypothetical protein